jgi:predicted porin
MIKKILTLSALALACATACAQSESSVNLYGSVDAGVSRVSGLRGGTNNQVVSGIMDGSRWGLRGNEEIGGGFRGLFLLESRLELNNGTLSNRPPSLLQVPDRLVDPTLLGLPATFQTIPAFKKAVTDVAAGIATQAIGVNLSNGVWDRQAYVGVVTPVGAVLAGRQYTPAYEVSGTFDTMQTQSSLAAGQVASIPASIDIRVSNALAYRIQVGAFSGGLMYTVQTSGADGNKTLKGLSAMYKTEPVSFGFGYNTRKNELGEKSLTSAVVGASVKIGPGSLNGMVASVKDDHPTDLSGIATLVAGLGAANAALVQTAFINGLKQDGRLAHVGYRFTAGASTVYVAYTSFNDKRPNNADVASYGAAYSYALSKRTDVNFAATRFNNKGALAQAAPGAAGYLGGVTDKAGVDATSIALGVRHKF